MMIPKVKDWGVWVRWGVGVLLNIVVQIVMHMTMAR